MFTKRKARSPFYKSNLFLGASALITISISFATLWALLFPSAAPNGRYVEFLVDSSEGMNEVVRNGVTKWDIAQSTIKKTIAYEIDKTDKVALRVFGGDCEDSINNTKLIIPFSDGVTNTTIEKLQSITPKGKPSFESGLVKLTGDFNNIEKIENIDRRVIAVIGSAPTCSGRAKSIIQKRLKNRYEFDIVLLGFKLDEIEKYQLLDFSKAAFIDSVLFSDTEGQLHEVAQVATNLDKVDLREAVSKNQEVHVKKDIIQLFRSRGVYFLEISNVEDGRNLLAFSIDCDKGEKNSFGGDTTNIKLDIYSNINFSKKLLGIELGSILKNKCHFEPGDFSGLMGNRTTDLRNFMLNGSTNLIYESSSNGESYYGRFDFNKRHFTINIEGKQIAFGSGTDIKSPPLNESYSLSANISPRNRAWIEEKFDTNEPESFFNRASKEFSLKYQSVMTVL